MRLVSEGAHHVSYRFMPSETIPLVLPIKVPGGYPFNKCSHCKEKGIFEYT